MAAPIAFESSWKKDEKRKQITEGREQILKKAKARYEIEEKKKEEARKRGEGTWMLPGLDDRIKDHNEEKSASKPKKKKKDKKKKKKKHKRKHTSSSESSESEEDKWVEKTGASEDKPIQGPQIQRDTWMMEGGLDSLMSGKSTAELRLQKEQKKEEERKLQALIDQPGQHSKELNPYWKDGGTGLPEEEKEHLKQLKQKVAPVRGAGDGGLAWLKQALRRCEQQAEDEGRSVEDVAAERYGSLKQLQDQIRDAEEQLAWSSRPSWQNRYDRQERSNRRRSRSRSKEKCREKIRAHSRDKNESRDSNNKSSRDSRDRRSRSQSREDRLHKRDEKESRHSKDWNSRERQYSERGQHRDLSRSKRSSSRDRYVNDRNKDTKHIDSRLKSLSGRFKRPDSDDRDSYSSSSKTASSDTPSWKKKAFMKPGEVQDGDSSSRYQKSKQMNKIESDNSSDSSDSNNSQSKPHQNSDKRDDSRYHPSSSSMNRGNWMKKKPEEILDVTKKVTPKQESSSSSSSSEESEEEKPPVKILTEEEMNLMGAKIIKAEIMGNEALAKKLKAELETARKAATECPAAPKATTSKNSHKDDQEENVVLLTRTDSRGMVRPVRESEGPVSHGKKRKRKTATHGSDGQRDRYFADDDQHNLKALVEQERLGTAEDSNYMFAKLAGRHMEKTDDDYQLDDAVLTKVAKKGVKTVEEERERAQAIMEHKKMAKSIEKCEFCFDTVPKHLIVAIGVKCYLCLPNHKSMNEGHCLIVPMQHVSQSTVLDEDIWDEIQIFRKVLTKMYLDRDEDVVFMETCMNLRYHPHMVIECVPMEKEIGDMAPIYFKKAIMECEGQWAENKKLVDLHNKDVRRAIPKGFAYFSVNFGNEGGFAHVIEDEKTFPRYFGREIVGGMCDLDPTLWRKPRRENFDDQRQKVLHFADMWKPYDWTKKIKQTAENSDSE